MQILTKYGSEELWVHVALRDIARIHHQCNRFDELVGVTTALCLVAQAIGQRVQHIGEAPARLKRHLTQCEHQWSFNKPSRERDAARTGGIRCKELANASLSSSNSLI